MGKLIHNDVYDAALAYVADNGTRMFLCSAEPASYQEASADNMLVQQTLTPGDGNGDFTIAEGDSSGRKLTVEAQTGITVTNSGTVTHVAICDSVNSKVLAVTEVNSPYAVTSGNTVNVPAFDLTLADPT